MKFGLMQLFQNPPGRTQQEVIRESLELATFAEEMGFDSVWLAEHHFSPYGLVGNPLVYAAALAQRTTRLTIGTAVLILPFYEPVRLAEEIALVDVLSDGRLQVGIGRGYQPLEFAGFRVDQGEARSRTDEVAEILRLALSQESFEFHGQHFDIPQTSIFPRPVQRPHPPILRAAVSRESFKRYGESGEPILTSPNFTPVDVVQDQFRTYVAALEDHGHDVSAYDRPLMQQTFIATTEEEAYAGPRESAMWYQRLLGTLVPGAHGETAPAGYEQWQRIAANIDTIEYDQIFKGGAVFATPETAIERIDELRRVAGVNHYIGWFDFGGLDLERAKRSIRLFAEEVMPAFASGSASGDGRPPEQAPALP
jgi:alkanesulfonate monooxygenase SsuD/methylene tetrahydromethanopterin reductase-like flavin-dependent oxidoreductase (luciferase family)